MALLPNGSSLTNSAPMVRQKRTWHPLSTIGRTRASIIGPKTVTCRFENGSEPCKVTDLQERCNDSLPCTQRPAIAFQFRPAAALHKQLVTIASKRSMPGKSQPASPEGFAAGAVAPRAKLNVTTPAEELHRRGCQFPAERGRGRFDHRGPDRDHCK